jgi:ELWxxDGT repeat protein
VEDRRHQSRTTVVKDINGKRKDYCCSELTAVGDTLFFEGWYTPGGGRFDPEVWRSDGTAAGTVRVKDINPDGLSGAFSSRYMTAIGDTLYFIASDGVHGVELWKSDGTAVGTVMVKDINPNQHANDLFSEPSSLVNVNGELFFSHVSDSTTSHALWKSDGTEGGTVKVMDQPNFWRPERVIEADGSLFFFALVGFEPRQYELWRSDGTTAGTQKVADNFLALGAQRTLGGNLLFAAAQGQPHVTKLWRSDGTLAGTQIVRTPGMAHNSDPGEMQTFAGALFLSARDSKFHRELWRTDGTTTMRVKNINRATSSDIRGLTDVGDRLYFFARPDTPALWTTDGTGAGTTRVTTRTWDALPSGIAISFNDKLFFTAKTRGETFAELWRSNGTERGTRPVVRSRR